MERPIKVLLVKPTHDCHDRGVRYVMRKMLEAGMEVIFTSFLMVQEIVDIAIEEDIDVVGVSSSSGGHMPVFEELIRALKDNGLEHVVVIGGGTIPQQDVDTLYDWGVTAVFGPGSTAEEAIATVRDSVAASGELSA